MNLSRLYEVWSALVLDREAGRADPSPKRVKRGFSIFPTANLHFRRQDGRLFCISHHITNSFSDKATKSTA
jgi:hypothetical protein